MKKCSVPEFPLYQMANSITVGPSDKEKNILYCTYK